MISLLLIAQSTSGLTPTAPNAARCVNGGPALLVTVTGLKSRTGKIRVRVYGGSTKTWFNNKLFLSRTEIRTPSIGPVAICVPVLEPGFYAVDVRHDINNDGETTRVDGGGVSGNPTVTLFDLLLSRKPPPAKVRVRVEAGITSVPVTMKYLSGGSFQPIP